MTSNLGGGADEAFVMNVVRNHFKPEFLNRIDEIVVFHRLDERHIARIVEIQVEVLRERLAERNLGLELTDAALAHIAAVGYDPDFGARPLKRVLQREVSDADRARAAQGRVPRRRRRRGRRLARRRPRLQHPPPRHRRLIGPTLPPKLRRCDVTMTSQRRRIVQKVVATRHARGRGS